MVDQPNTSSPTLSSMMVFQKPKRQFTAYNFFFQQERQRLLASLPDNNTTNGSIAKSNAARRSKKHAHNKIGFADLGRAIAARWKKLSPEEKRYYEELAAQDKIRHKRQMAVWEARERERIAILMARRQSLSQDNNEGTQARSNSSSPSSKKRMNKNAKQQEKHIHSNTTNLSAAVSAAPLLVASRPIVHTRSPSNKTIAGAGLETPPSAPMSLPPLGVLPATVSSSSLVTTEAATPPVVARPLLGNSHDAHSVALLLQQSGDIESSCSSSPGSPHAQESLLLACNTKNLCDKDMLDQLQHDMGDECTALFMQVFRPTLL